MKKSLIFAVALMFGIIAIQAQTQKNDAKKIANKSEVAFHISNMHEEHCQAIIEKSLAYEKGVRDLKFDLKGQNLIVVYNPQKTNVENIQKALKKLGYDAKLSTQKECPLKTENKSCCKSK